MGTPGSARIHEVDDPPQFGINRVDTDHKTKVTVAKASPDLKPTGLLVPPFAVRDLRHEPDARRR